MDRKSKALFVMFIVALGVAAFLSYWRYVVAHDYLVTESEPKGTETAHLETPAPE